MAISQLAQEVLEGKDPLDGQMIKGCDGNMYLHNDLKRAFDQVCDKQNWKLPINASIYCTVEWSKVVREAIIYYTGSVPRVFVVYSGKPLMKLNFVADGYYKAIGA